MKTKEVLEEIQAQTEGEEVLLAEGLEDALIGMVELWVPQPGGGASRQEIALYDKARCVRVLEKRDGMTPEDAEEFLEFNTYGAYVGPGTPAFARILR